MSARRVRAGARPRTGGYTLVEALVALTIGALILVGLVTMLLETQRSWDRSREVATESQDTRAAMLLMLTDVRMAGSGYGGRPVTTGGVPGNILYPLQPAPGGANTDTLHVLGNLSGVSTITTTVMGSASDNIFVQSDAGFQTGDLIVVTNGVEANLFEVTATSPGTNVLAHSPSSAYNDPSGHLTWPSGGYQPGSTVVPVEQISYWVETADDGAQRLVRQVRGQNPVPVAAGVETLRVMFQLAGGGVTSNPADPTLIRSVSLACAFPATHDGDTPDTLSIEGRPRVLR